MDYKDCRSLKNWCFWTVVLEKTLESPLDFKKIQPVNPKEISPEYFWKDWCSSWNSNPLATWCEELTHWKRSLCWERMSAKEKGTTEDEMIGWHHQLNEHEFEQGIGDGQGGLACCSLWGYRKSDMTERLNWTDQNQRLWNIWWNKIKSRISQGVNSRY